MRQIDAHRPILKFSFQRSNFGTEGEARAVDLSPLHLCNSRKSDEMLEKTKAAEFKLILSSHPRIATQL